MNAPQYGYNSTTGPAKVATGTARKTMLQLQANPLGPALRVVEWGVSFDASALATPGVIELVETGVQGASGTNWTAAKMPQALLSTAISSGATTSFIVATGGGALFVPQYGGSAQTMRNGLAVVCPIEGAGGPTGPFTGASELVLITARSTDTLTVTRDVDGRAGGGLTSIPVGSPLTGIAGQFQEDIVTDNNGLWWPPNMVVFQNCGWNNGGGANGTDFGSVTQNRYLAPFAAMEQIGTPGPTLLPLGREPEIQPGCYARIVATFAATVNMTCWMKVAA